MLIFCLVLDSVIKKILYYIKQFISITQIYCIKVSKNCILFAFQYWHPYNLQECFYYYLLHHFSGVKESNFSKDDQEEEIYYESGDASIRTLYAIFQFVWKLYE